MKRLILILVFTIFHQISPSTLLNESSKNFNTYDLSKLAYERTTNLIISNDKWESYSTFPLATVFPWTKHTDAEQFQFGATTIDLALALSENQLVLCNKLTWHNVQFYAQMWENFATKSESELWILYKNHTFLKKIDFSNKIKKIIPIIQKNQKIYEELNTLLSENAIFDDVLKFIKSIPHDTKSINNQEDADIHDSLSQLFLNYAQYCAILNRNYQCKQVNQDFILFIPKNLLSINNNPIFDSLHLGLNIANLPDYNYQDLPKTIASKIDQIKSAAKESWEYYISSDKTLGQSLPQALQVLAINSKDMPTSSVAPFFNIVFSGHGSPQNTTAGLSCTIITDKNQNQSSVFLNFLNTLQNKFQIKTLIIGSCFSSGKKIHESFILKNRLYGKLLDKYSFPIVIIGATPTVTSSPDVNSILPYHFTEFNFLKNGYFKDIPTFCPNRYFYTQCFYQLNKPEGPDYLTAVNSIASIYKDINDEFTIQNPNHWIIIKFPNVSWFTPAQFKKEVIELNQIAMSTASKEFTIPSDAKMLLLSANNIFSSLKIKTFEPKASEDATSTQSLSSEDTMTSDDSTSDETTNGLSTIEVEDKDSKFKNMPAQYEYTFYTYNQNYHPPLIIMPVNYYNQNYVFHELSYPDESEKPAELESIMAQFFAVEEIREEIKFVIKKLTIGSKIYTNVLIFIFKSFVTSFGRFNGFIYTDSTNKTYITRWKSDKQFLEDAQTTTFSKASAENMIAEVEKNALKALPQALKPEFLTQLSQVIANKAKNSVPNKVRNSQEIIHQNNKEESTSYKKIDKNWIRILKQDANTLAKDPESII